MLDQGFSTFSYASPWHFYRLKQWFPTFFLSRRILEKNENYLAHLEYFEYKIIQIDRFLHITTKN